MPFALAENLRTATKAAIKRATFKAHRDMRRLDREALAALERQYRAAANDLRLAIEARAAQDGTIKLAVLRDTLDHVNGRLNQLSDARNSLLNQNMDAAALLGVRPYENAVINVSLISVAHEAAQFARAFVAEDGLQLSDRLWRLDRGAREAVANAIQQAVIKGYSGSQAAQDFLRRGDPIPSEIIADINAAHASGVAKSAAEALMGGDGSPYDNARRVFRTEINRAHGEAYFKASDGHPDVAGYRFLLSPAHPRPDICDMHASANLYGLGPGVYPSRASCPWPAHPNTLSFVEVVFKDEISAHDKQSKDPSRVAWLKQQPIYRQAAVLGGARKQAAFAAGVLRENEIATPWRVLKAKYARRGIDVTQFIPSTAEPGPSLIKPALQSATTAGSPVSQALDVTFNKEKVGRVLTAIDKVHGDGALPIIPLKRLPSNASYEGAYYRTYSDEAVKIALRAGADHPELTVAHEIGHFIDHKGFPGAGYASPTSPLFAGWRDAIRNSEAFKRLQALAAGPDLHIVNGRGVGINKGYVDYLSSWHELWARSYAQYIAMKSGDETMLSQLLRLIEKQQGASIIYPRQWVPGDFNAIQKSIDDIMRSMGWV